MKDFRRRPRFFAIYLLFISGCTHDFTAVSGLANVPLGRTSAEGVSVSAFGEWEEQVEFGVSYPIVLELCNQRSEGVSVKLGEVGCSCSEEGFAVELGPHEVVSLDWNVTGRWLGKSDWELKVNVLSVTGVGIGSTTLRIPLRTTHDFECDGELLANGDVVLVGSTISKSKLKPHLEMPSRWNLKSFDEVSENGSRVLQWVVGLDHRSSEIVTLGGPRFSIVSETGLELASWRSTNRSSPFASTCKAKGVGASSSTIVFLEFAHEESFSVSEISWVGVEGFFVLGWRVSESGLTCEIVPQGVALENGVIEGALLLEADIAGDGMSWLIPVDIVG